MLSVVIPAYNEGPAIEQTIAEIRGVLEKNSLNHEIIIVDDGSSDDTGKIAEKCGAVVVRNPHNMGYGFSLKKGIEKASNDTIVITDADLTYPFEYVPQMLEEKKKGFDLIVGNRTGKHTMGGPLKRLLRFVLKKIVEFVTERDIPDINSGLRVFDKHTVTEYFPRLCDTFSFSTSQTLAYMMNGKFVKYVDIPYNKRKGKSHVKMFKDTLKTLKYIIEACIYYNPLKIFTFLTVICIILSIIGFFVSHFIGYKVGYFCGIGGLLVSIIVFSMGMLATVLKQIMNK